MGLSAARGHMRPFGSRSPPFLVATLCVGLCVLAISYWRLGIQYNDLEEQLRRLIQKKDSLEANESFISKQLELREENFSEAKVNLQKKEKELIDLKKRLDEDDVKLKETQKTQDSLKRSLEKLKIELEAKETTLQELHDKNKALENENVKLKSDYTEVKSKLDSVLKSSNNRQLEAGSKLTKDFDTQAQQADRSQLTNVIHPPENINDNLPKLNILASSQSNIKSKQTYDKPNKNSKEQIQKPKIDPVVNFVKNNLSSNNNQNGDNDHEALELSNDEMNRDHNNDKKADVYHIDEENGGAGGKLEDKDALLDSNNLDDNTL